MGRDFYKRRGICAHINQLWTTQQESIRSFWIVCLIFRVSLFVYFLPIKVYFARYLSSAI